jgi:hypothetical protein
MRHNCLWMALVATVVLGSAVRAEESKKNAPKVVENTIGRRAKIAVGTFAKPIQPNWTELVFKTKVRQKERETRITWSDVYARAPFARWELAKKRDYYNNREYETIKHRLQVYTAATTKKVVGARIHALIAGGMTWPGTGKGGGGHAAHKRTPNWFSLAVDLDVDVDSNRDGKIAVNNASDDAKQEDKIEATDPVGAPVGKGARSPFVIRRLIEKWEKGRRPLSSLLKGHLILTPIKGSIGRIAIYEKDTKTLAFEPYKQDGAKTRTPGLIMRKDLFAKLLDGKKDLEFEMKGLTSGTLAMQALLLIGPRDATAPATEFTETVKVLVCGVEFVPYVDINDKIERDKKTWKIVKRVSEPGRGKVPHIPLNAVLPKRLSGTGASAQVRVALKVTAPPGSYSFEVMNWFDPKFSLSHDRKLSVIVKKDQTTGYSNTGRMDDLRGTVVLKGTRRSSHDCDYCQLYAFSKPDPKVPGVGSLTRISAILTYEFEFEMPVTMTGNPAIGISSHMKKSKEKKSFDGDRTVGRLGKKGMLKPFDSIKGLEMSSGPVEYVWSDYWGTSWRSFFATRSFCTAVFSDSGGASVVASPLSRPTEHAVLYARTASGERLLGRNMFGYNPKGSYSQIGYLYGQGLRKRDTTEKLSIVAGTLAAKKGDPGLKGVSVAKKGTGQLKLLDHYPLNRVFDAGSSALLKKDIQSSLQHNAAVVYLITRPKGAHVFAGRASCPFRVTRKGKWHLYAWSPLDDVSLALAVGKCLPLEHGGIDFGQLLSAVELPANRGETYVAAYTNLTFGLNSGEQTVDMKDRSILKWVVDGYTAQGTDLNKPEGAHRIANGNAFYRDRHLISGIVDMTAKMDEDLVFRVQTTNTPPTTIPIWSTSTTCVRKQAALCEGYAILELGGITYYSESSAFEIWTLDN